MLDLTSGTDGPWFDLVIHASGIRQDGRIGAPWRPNRFALGFGRCAGGVSGFLKGVKKKGAFLLFFFPPV